MSYDSYTTRSSLSSLYQALLIDDHWWFTSRIMKRMRLLSIACWVWFKKVTRTYHNVPEKYLKRDNDNNRWSLRIIDETALTTINIDVDDSEFDGTWPKSITVALERWIIPHLAWEIILEDSCYEIPIKRTWKSRQTQRKRKRERERENTQQLLNVIRAKMVSRIYRERFTIFSDSPFLSRVLFHFLW